MVYENLDMASDKVLFSFNIDSFYGNVIIDNIRYNNYRCTYDDKY